MVQAVDITFAARGRLESRSRSNTFSKDDDLAKTSKQFLLEMKLR